jgi:hypothetical protein
MIYEDEFDRAKAGEECKDAVLHAVGCCWIVGNACKQVRVEARFMLCAICIMPVLCVHHASSILPDSAACTMHHAAGGCAGLVCCKGFRVIADAE